MTSLPEQSASLSVELIVADRLEIIVSSYAAFTQGRTQKFISLSRLFVPCNRFLLPPPLPSLFPLSPASK